MLPYRGLLSCEFLTLAEAHPQVLHISHRPRPVQWWNGEEWETYYPRYAVVMKTGVRGVSRTVDIEVANSAEYSADRRKYARIKRQCGKDGRLFLVFTEKHIRVEPRLTNAKIILTQAGKGLVSSEDKNLIRQIAHGTKNFTLNQLVEIGVLSYDRAYSAALNMVANGELSISLTRQFDGNTVIARRA